MTMTIDLSPVYDLEPRAFMTTPEVQGLEIDRADLRHTRIITLPERDLDDGEVRFRLDSFSFTSNNISYALYGDRLKYWNFFPSGSHGWGRLPVWAFASVEDSMHPEFEPGERFYGYFPMCGMHTLKPGAVSDGGFVDGAPHRENLPDFYNHYTRVSADPSYRADFENQQLLFRPLFLTAFLIDDQLGELNFHGADQIILTSASSKTAMALAWLLRQRNVKVVGVTSRSGRAFAKNSQNYDDVILYDEVADTLKTKSSVLLNFTGALDKVTQIHQLLGTHLKASYCIGCTHWDQAAPFPDVSAIPGPEPQFFVATRQGRKRIEEWGMRELQRQITARLLEFYGPASGWIKAARAIGADAVQECYDMVLASKTLPSEGYILSFDY